MTITEPKLAATGLAPRRHIQPNIPRASTNTCAAMLTLMAFGSGKIRYSQFGGYNSADSQPARKGTPQ